MFEFDIVWEKVSTNFEADMLSRNSTKHVNKQLSFLFKRL